MQCISIGKHVANYLYLHISTVTVLEDQATRDLIMESLCLLSEEEAAQVNVIKINQINRAVSMLQYADFDSDPFPRLLRVWVRSGDGSRSVARRNYEQSSNPPILHRKELLVAGDYPGRDEWIALTQSAEAVGLFDDTATIGFAMNWDRLIASKSLQLTNGRLLPLGNDVNRIDADHSLTEVVEAILRHRTALTRVALSAPVQLLVRHDLLQIGATFFDYGCGRGGDMERLSAEGVLVGGWDPYFAPTATIGAADVVNLGFVINVIEDPAERLDALKAAFALCRKVLCVGVMLNGSQTAGQVTYGDGVLSGRKTFQKYFTQSEFKSYLETVLGREAHLVSPGVAFVFSDAGTEFRFLSRRYRARNVAPRLLAASRLRKPLPERCVREPRPGARVSKEPPKLSPHVVAAMEGLWQQSLDLGRIPDENEAISVDVLKVEFVTFRSAVKALSTNRDMALLEHACRARKDDLDLYFAIQHFTRLVDRKNLDPTLKRDIRHFYGSLSEASAAGMQLLRAAADPQKIFEACVSASEQGTGWLDSQCSLQLEAILVERLPAILRAYVACGIQLCGAISEFQIVKIHVGSGGVSLMDYADFESPVPRLRRRIKVNLRRQDIQIFEYGTPEHPMPPLVQKSRYMSEDSPTYAEQVSFDEQMERLGLSERGLGYEDLLYSLRTRRVEIYGHTLRRHTIPPCLDELCGRFLRYRDFVECSKTQWRFGIDNKPLRVESYNALYDLAVHVLDPVIDYFGAIKLTYGLCTAVLGRSISRRVAPKLDQHAAAERDSRGSPICKRAGAACDFIVEDENMAGVADWIIANIPFDRLYYYGPDRPLHVSYGPDNARQAYRLTENSRGRLIPSKYVANRD